MSRVLYAALALLLLGCNSGAPVDNDDENEIITTPCSVPGMYGGDPVTLAVQSFPGMSADDILTSVWVVRQNQADITIGDTEYSTPDVVPVGDDFPDSFIADGSVAIVCELGQATVALFVRCDKEGCQ